MYFDDNVVFEHIVEHTSRFTLNSAGRSPANRRAEQRQRSLQFRQHGLPQRMIYDDGCKLLASPGKENLPTEELSFYQSHSPQQSPRPCSPCTLCPDDALGGELLPSENTTPGKHMAIPTIGSKAGPLVAGKLVASSLGYRLRRPLDDHDPNSMDSGYGASVLNDVLMSSLHSTTTTTSSSSSSSTSVTSAKTLFPFNHSSGASPASTRSRRLLLHSSLSSGSMESMDDMELFDMEAMEDDEDELGKSQSYQQSSQPQQPHQQQQGTMPSGLSSLICGTIKTTRTATTPEQKRPFVRRCLSLTENTNHTNLNLPVPHHHHQHQQLKTPERYVRRTIAMEDQENCNLTPYSSRTSDVARCFKRPEPPGVSPVQSKRSRIALQQQHQHQQDAVATAAVSALDSPARTTVLVATVPKKVVYQKSISMNDAQIMSALSRSSSEPDLIGDFSKSYVLPLMDGQHRDLKAISGDTMARLVRGDYTDKIASFKIIDCRYPYEFDGGHIRGAKNLYTQEQIVEELIKSKTEPPTVTAAGGQDGTMRRHIIVFHCEFSSERGPKLSRFLRNHDRILNADSYPALHYPEMYLLHGGYKEFYKAHAELCDPIAYRPMLDPDYGDAYRHFRAKSRSWNGDGTGTVKASDKSTGGSLPGGGGPSRLTKSRSRLVL
uniref:protein-tyrosine-phosphatase n=1 Tax=Anopheles dirus TaxID=7168 RepID=A0A182NL68_9DIPT